MSGTFPETVETDPLTLIQLCRERVDVFDPYELFAERREGVEAVFEYVPQEPYAPVQDARDQLVEAGNHLGRG